MTGTRALKYECGHTTGGNEKRLALGIEAFRGQDAIVGLGMVGLDLCWAQVQIRAPFHASDCGISSGWSDVQSLWVAV